MALVKALLQTIVNKRPIGSLLLSDDEIIRRCVKTPSKFWYASVEKYVLFNLKNMALKVTHLRNFLQTLDMT